MKSNRYADADADTTNPNHASLSPIPRTRDVLTREYLAVLALVDIADSEARDSIVVRHSPVDVQERKRSVTALLSVHANNAEANTLVKVVVQSDTFGKVRAGVQSAGALVVVDCGSDESVFEDPVGASLRTIQTSNGTVAGRVDAILVVKVDHGNDTSDVDAPEVADTSSIVGWCLELREFALGDLALADSVVVVLVAVGEDIDIAVAIIAIVASVLAEWASEDRGGKSEDGENGGC
jgi:hypothetical protein